MSKAKVFIQVQLVTMASVPSFKKMNRGAKLTKNASLTAVLTWEVAHPEGVGRGLRVERIGRARRVRTSRREVVTIVILCIASTWTCTKSFWFLRPTDDCYPLEANILPREPRGLTEGVKD